MSPGAGNPVEDTHQDACDHQGDHDNRNRAEHVADYRRQLRLLLQDFFASLRRQLLDTRAFGELLFHKTSPSHPLAEQVGDYKRKQTQQQERRNPTRSPGDVLNVGFGSKSAPVSRPTVPTEAWGSDTGVAFVAIVRFLHRKDFRGVYRNLPETSKAPQW